jgi:omega-amidase
MSVLPVTLVQTHLYWEDPEKNRKMITEKIIQHTQPGQVVVLPEMFTGGFTMQADVVAETMEGETVSWMKQLSKERKIILCGSMVIEEKDQDPTGNTPLYFNRLLWVLPNGEIGIYNKRHLFGYAGEDQVYTAGNNRLIASVKGWKINLQICYDLRFPVWARQDNEHPEYDVLVYVANWPARRAHAWRSLLIARAIENQCYVIGVNRVGKDGNGIDYSGNSMVIDPLGEVLKEISDIEEIYTIELSYTHLQDIRTRFPFLKDRDQFSLLV